MSSGELMEVKRLGSKPSCPKCKKQLDAYVDPHGHGKEPAPGYQVVCSYCYTLCRYVEGPNNTFDLIEVDRTKLHPVENMEITILIRTLKALKQGYTS